MTTPSLADGAGTHMSDDDFLNQLEATILEAQAINRAGRLMRADEIKMSLNDADKILALARKGVALSPRAGSATE